MGYLSRKPLGSKPRWASEKEAILEQLELAQGLEPVTAILKDQLAQLEAKEAQASRKLEGK